MSSTTLASSASLHPPPGLRVRWIISQREDLIWFIGSALAGYLVIALLWAGVPTLPIQLVWFLVIDSPHVLATATRTYFDKEERRKLGWLLWIPVPLVLLGPAMILLGQGALFFLFAFCWQQLHVTKQHLGFMMLYKAKNGERDRTDFKLDRWLLLSSLFVPLALFLVKTEPWIAALPGIDWVRNAAILGYGVFCGAWLVRQAQKLRSGAEMNWPKLALLAGVVPLQWLALQFGARYGPNGTLQAAIALGTFHSLQYHRLLWFHNRNRYRAPDAHERNGLAATLAVKASRYFAVAVGLSTVLVFLPPLLVPSDLVSAAVWGIPFTHFLLDSKIWRVRKDKALAAALQIA